MLLVHVALIYCLHNGCLLFNKCILIVGALTVDCIRSVCSLHRQYLYIDRKCPLTVYAVPVACMHHTC